MCRVKARWINSLGIAVFAAGLGVATAARCCAMVPLSDAELARVEGGNKIWQCRAVDCCSNGQSCCIVDAEFVGPIDPCISFGMCGPTEDFCQKKRCWSLYRCAGGNKLATCVEQTPYDCEDFYGGPRQPGDLCECIEWCGGTNESGCTP